MKKPLLLTLLAILLLQACNSDSSTTKNADAYVPDFVLKDSLVIDHLGPLTMLDYHRPTDHYLMYSYQEKELLVIDGEGKILVEANRSGQGPDNYQTDHFYRAQFISNDQISVITIKNEFIYNKELGLEKKYDLKYPPFANRRILANGIYKHGDYGVMFGIAEEEAVSINPKNWGTDLYQLPIIKVLKQSTQELIVAKSIPENTNVRQEPGTYNNVAPFIQVENNKAYFLYPPSPEVYVYTWPNLDLLDTINLNPELGFKLIEPARADDNFGDWFATLAGSTYDRFFFSGEYMVTSYLSAASRDEVNQLPRNVVGGEAYNKVERSKFNVYQIFKSKEKIWEGKRDFNINFLDDLAYATVKPGEEYTEKDQTVFYFYSLE